MVDRCHMESGPLSEATKAVAQKELRETPEIVQEALAKLKQLIKEDGKVKIADDDNLLLVFLRPCKFHPESALALIRRSLEFKQKNAALLDGLRPQDEKESMSENIVNVMVDRDQAGRRILLVKLGEAWDPKKVNTDQIFRIFYLVHLAAMLEPETQVNGVVVILDFKGLGMKQVAGFSPTFSMRLLTFIQEAMPIRLKEVHVVKEPFLFNMVWTMFKPFVGAKLKNRLYFHGDKMPSLHKHINPENLPQDYKGNKPAINYTGKDWYPEFLKVEDFIAQWDSFKVSS